MRRVARGLVSVRRFALLGAVLALGIFGTACWGDDGAEPSLTPAPPPTQQATPTSAASATRTVTPSPTAVPATSTPRPSPTTVAATSTPRPGLLIEHGDRSSKRVALTFDMGGRIEPALDIMNWLIRNEVHATVFMTGAMADNPNTDAGRGVLRLVGTHPELFDLGNHSYSHPDFRELTPTAMGLELIRAENAFAAFIDVSPRPWFRPPYGGVDNGVVSAAAAAGYDRTIMWDVDTIDWRPESEGGSSAAEIVAKVTSKAQGGSIVIMHLGGYNTLEALPSVVAGLHDRGFELVTLDELLD